LQRPPDDGLLLRRGRIADEHLHHESVDLRLGERIGAVGLDRVLGRHDQERLRDGERFAPDGHLPLLHDLQQRALHLRGRAVDLVGQQQVGEYRPEGHIELARRLVVDPGTDEVGRHQVGSELDSLELPADRASQRLDRERLGQPRDALNEQVTAGEHGNRHALEQYILTNDRALDLEQHRFERARRHGITFPRSFHVSGQGRVLRAVSKGHALRGFKGVAPLC
jgi:hypothetical protein